MRYGDERKGAKESDDDDDDVAVPRHYQIAEAKPPVKGLHKLDIAAVVKNERNPHPREEYERVEEFLDSMVLVIFRLPDGSEGEKHFKMGHTVEVLKSFVEEEFEIPMSICQLYIGDKLMLNPLSLSDYPEMQPSGEVYLRVDGCIPDSASKK